MMAPNRALYFLVLAALASAELQGVVKLTRSRRQADEQLAEGLKDGTSLNLHCTVGTPGNASDGAHSQALETAIQKIQNLMTEGKLILYNTQQSFTSMESLLRLMENSTENEKKRRHQYEAKISFKMDSVVSALEDLANFTESSDVAMGMSLEHLRDMQSQELENMTSLLGEQRGRLSEFEERLEFIKEVVQRNEETLMELTRVVSKPAQSPPRTCRDVDTSQPRQTVVLESGLEVLCDTETDGGGWIVIQRRVRGQVDFYRTWMEYKYGFGQLDDEFWFGNDKIFHLTNLRRYELRIDLVFKNESYYARYDSFSLTGEDDSYRLRLGAYSGNAGDNLLATHNGQKFSTYDSDRDPYSGNCAESYHGAWWYGECHNSNLNGLWGDKNYAKGLTWHHLTAYYDSVEFSEMKIRPLS